MNVDCPATINNLAICAGVGGLELGLDLATSGAVRTVCYVEREAHAAAVLARRMEEKALAPAPVWSDLRTFDGRPWRGIVDCISGGYPCQPFSHAGRRRGSNDPRHLWPSIALILEEIEPVIVFFENVAGHLSLGFADVRRELEGLGYRVTAGLFTAAEVGASHRRQRLFILGIRRGLADGAGGGCGEQRQAARAGRERHADGGNGGLGHAQDDHRRRGERREEEGTGPGKQRRRGSTSPDCGMADTQRCGSQDEPELSTQRRESHAADGGQSVADAEGGTGSVHSGQRGPGEGTRDVAWPGGMVHAGSGRGWEHIERPRSDRGTVDIWASGGDNIPLFPPPPGDIDGWRRIIERRSDLAPAVEPRVRRVADGLAGRLDRLRACGNGVVPLEAAYAFVSLWACLREGD